MEYPACGGGAGLSGNVPAFLTKLWTLVEDPDTDPLICWSPSGTSFHVFDQGRFSKEVLPKFFKHNNMASFIRQLNMYGFRKVVHIEQGGLVKPERDDTEFQHPFFIRGQENLLENIKRKVTAVSSVRQDEMKMSADEVNKILNDVQLMKGKQETIDSRIIAMRHENEALWREVASLRQKHSQQQKVVNKLIQFLVSLVQSNRIMGVKRKLPLMLNDSSSAHSMPKYSRPFPLEHMQAAASLFSGDSPMSSGPIISDITDVATPTAQDAGNAWTDAGESQSAVKQEPSSPDVEVVPVLEGGAPYVDTPLSPTTFINSILLENEIQPTPNSSAPGTVSPIILMSPPSTGPRPQTPAGQSLSSASIPTSASIPCPAKAPQKCQTVACIDRSALSDHVESIDTDLENLQSILNTQSFSFDTSPLMDFFSSPVSPEDIDLASVVNLLSEDAPKGSDVSSNSNRKGKQLVQYSSTPVHMTEPVSSGEGGADLPSLLELEAEPFLSPDMPTDDPSVTLLSHAPSNSDL